MTDFPISLSQMFNSMMIKLCPVFSLQQSAQPTTGNLKFAKRPTVNCEGISYIRRFFSDQLASIQI